MSFSLSGQVALVTGGSRGIGASIVRRLANAGATVIINYRSNDEAAEKILNEIKKVSPKSSLKKFNIADASESEKAIEEILKEYEFVSTLVCNAGISRDNLLPRVTDDQFREVLETNLLGGVRLIRLCTRSMMRQKFGRIISIGSIIGEMGNKGQTAYAASKSALFGFTKSVALEFASRGITANVICPGFIETEMTGQLTPEVQKTYLDRIPSGRFGSPEEVAATVHFLASTEAAYITGASVDINGGLLML